MPDPDPARRKIVQLAEKGTSAARIAQRIDLSIRAVRHLVNRFRERAKPD